MTTVVIENSSVTLLARVFDAHGDLITQADIASISLKVYNADSGDEVVPAPEVVVAEVVFDEIQKDARWSVDDIGYNLAIPLGGAAFPTQGNYQIEAKITPTDGLSFYVYWEVTAQNIFSE